MELEKIFEIYAEKMTQVYLYQRSMQSLAKKELEWLRKFNESHNETSTGSSIPFSLNNMSFRRAVDGELVFFGQSRMSTEEKIVSIHVHKNKQYQWLLVEAYEEFEDCLEKLWAYLGCKNLDSWPLQDYGNVHLNELSGKNFKWFEEKASKKQGKPGSIISTLRNKFPKIKEIENNNKLEINLYLAIKLIEEIRHVIVHKGGVVGNKEDFIEKVLKNCGLFNSGKPQKEYENFIKGFFGDGDYENHIILLEIPTKTNLRLGMYVNLFELICGYMMSYIEVIKDILSEKESRL